MPAGRPAQPRGTRPGSSPATSSPASTAPRSPSYDQLSDLIRANDDGEAVIGYSRDGTHHEHHGPHPYPVAPGLRRLGQARRRRLPRRPADDPPRDRRSALHARADGLHRRADRGGRDPAPAAGLGRGHGHHRPPGPRPGEPGQHRRRKPAGGRDRVAADEEFSTDKKIVYLLLLIAGFNFFIGAFNFIPLLPLDGGHIASALWEAIRRGFARLRGRPDPGFVDAARLLPIAYVMASFMLVMSLVLIIGDFVVPLHLQT